MFRKFVNFSTYFLIHWRSTFFVKKRGNVNTCKTELQYYLGNPAIR
jgi:hypothetical protein